MPNKTIQAHSYGTHNTTVGFVTNKIPDSCPVCHAGIEPIWRFGWIEGDPAYAIYQCPKVDCRRLFISYFEISVDPRDPIHYFKGSYPWRPTQHDFPNEIKTISPGFCSIYDESHEAEQRKLAQICGAGYRKALEFLIKDYLIKEVGLDGGIVKKKLLGNCISEHIDDKRIRECSKRAAWLGNDETHYDRKWEDKDLEDLKILINLTCNWIQSDCLTKKFISEMPEKKSTGEK
jgi:hypothetical protein